MVELLGRVQVLEVSHLLQLRCVLQYSVPYKQVQTLQAQGLVTRLLCLTVNFLLPRVTLQLPYTAKREKNFFEESLLQELEAELRTSCTASWLPFLIHLIISSVFKLSFSVIQFRPIWKYTNAADFYPSTGAVSWLEVPIVVTLVWILIFFLKTRAYILICIKFNKSVLLTLPSAVFRFLHLPFPSLVLWQ